MATSEASFCWTGHALRSGWSDTAHHSTSDISLPPTRPIPLVHSLFIGNAKQASRILDPSHPISRLQASQDRSDVLSRVFLALQGQGRGSGAPTLHAANEKGGDGLLRPVPATPSRPLGAPERFLWRDSRFDLEEPIVHPGNDELFALVVGGNVQSGLVC